MATLNENAFPIVTTGIKKGEWKLGLNSLTFEEVCVVIATTVFSNGLVNNFSEKPQISDGWVNGGFFVCEPNIFDFIENDQTIFEREPLEQLSKLNEFAAFEHEGFWQCMDTKRDKTNLDSLWNSGQADWAKNWDK